MKKIRRNINAYDLNKEARELADAVVAWRRDNEDLFPKASDLIKIIVSLGWEKTSE